jgi:hypothetical protein
MCVPLKNLLHALQTLPLGNLWLLRKVTELLSEEIASVKTAATENKWTRFEKYMLENFLSPNSRFSMSIWSQNHFTNITTGGYDRSNNASESVNSSIAKCHTSNRMTIEESISAIWTFQRSNLAQFAAFNRGYGQLNPKCKKIATRDVHCSTWVRKMHCFALFLRISRKQNSSKSFKIVQNERTFMFCP